MILAAGLSVEILREITVTDDSRPGWRAGMQMAKVKMMNEEVEVHIAVVNNRGQMRSAEWVNLQ
jgi:hypothetical protein